MKQLEPLSAHDESWATIVAIDRAVLQPVEGTLYTKLGQPDLAFEHRVLGFGSRAHSAWRPLEAAWEAHPYWHHEGAEGYFADRSAIFDQPSTGREPEAEPGAGNQESHTLLGHPIPDLEFDLDGAEARLSDFEGPVLVELWATW